MTKRRSLRREEIRCPRCSRTSVVKIKGRTEFYCDSCGFRFEVKNPSRYKKVSVKEVKTKQRSKTND